MSKADNTILDNWTTLNTGLKKLPEAEVLRLLEIEKVGERRIQFLLRLYGRYSMLRRLRERKELLAE